MTLFEMCDTCELVTRCTAAYHKTCWCGNRTSTRKNLLRLIRWDDGSLETYLESEKTTVQAYVAQEEKRRKIKCVKII